MAYITKEQVQEIRNEIKASFPKNFKFSVVREHYSVVQISLMQSPLNFEKTTNYQHPKEHKTIMRILKAIANKDNFDHSDAMIDYFHVGHYTRVWLGKWDKPYTQN